MSLDVYGMDDLAQATAALEIQASREQQLTDNIHLVAFFEQYDGFTYRRNAPVMAEFNRLCNSLNLGEEDIRTAQRSLRSAMTRQFNATYGRNNLESWQNLCDILEITPVPLTLKQCQEILKTKFVNLVDLVDRANTGQKVKMFADLKELQDYTKKENKYFPREVAKADGLLKCFLQIMGGSGQKKGKGKRRRRSGRGRGRNGRGRSGGARGG